MSLTLPPELNAGSHPVSTTARMPASRAMAAQAATISSTALLPVSALRVSGWLMVSVRIAPSRADLRKGVVIGDSSCSCGVGGDADQLERRPFAAVDQLGAEH